MKAEGGGAERVRRELAFDVFVRDLVELGVLL